MALPVSVSTPPVLLAMLMPFWAVKFSASPDWSVPGEIVTVAPVRSVSKDETVKLGSITAPVPPTVNSAVTPDAVTTGAAMATLTVSDTGLLVSVPSDTKSVSVLGVVLVLVVENVTDCKAAWYCATVASPLSKSEPAEKEPAMPFWLVKLSWSPVWRLLLEIVMLAASRLVVDGRDRDPRIDRYWRTADGEGVSAPRGRNRRGRWPR